MLDDPEQQNRRDRVKPEPSGAFYVVKPGEKRRSSATALCDGRASERHRAYMANIYYPATTPHLLCVGKRETTQGCAAAAPEKMARPMDPAKCLCVIPSKILLRPANTVHSMHEQSIGQWIHGRETKDSNSTQMGPLNHYADARVKSTMKDSLRQRKALVAAMNQCLRGASRRLGDLEGLHLGTRPAFSSFAQDCDPASLTQTTAKVPAVA